MVIEPLLCGYCLCVPWLPSKASLKSFNPRCKDFYFRSNKEVNLLKPWTSYVVNQMQQFGQQTQRSQNFNKVDNETTEST